MTSIEDGPPLLTSGVIPASFRHGFSTRTGGVSRPPFDSLNVGRTWGDEAANVAENRRRLLAASGARVLLHASQVHGRDVGVVEVGDTPAMVADRRVDALCCNTPYTAIAVLVADCVPIVFAAPGAAVCAVAHAGWRGTVAGVAAATVEILRARFGVDAGDVRVALGPSIGPCCFEVGDEVVEAFERRFPVASGVDGGIVARTPGRKAHVDLWRANRRALREAGVKDEHIDVLGACTACDREHFFSYRRDGHATGQQLAFVSCP